MLAGDRRLHHLRLTGLERDDADDELGGVAEGGVQQPAQPRAEVTGHHLGRRADPPRQRDQRQRGEHEDPGASMQPGSHDRRRQENQQGQEDDVRTAEARTCGGGSHERRAASRRSPSLDQAGKALDRPEVLPMAERSPRNMTDYEAEYAAFRWDRPERFNFAIDVVDRWASERPDAPALLHCDDRGNRKVYSWRELAERSVHAALFLRDLGLRPGDGVFTMLPRLAEWWILALGCMRANLVLMPGTTMLTGKDVRYRLELGRARAVVTTAEHVSKFEVGAHADVIGWICTDEAPTPWVRFRTQTVDGARAAEFPETAADDRMLVYFTSGTTGMPKMVPQTHASYGIGHGVTGKYWLDLGPDDIHFTLSDTGWAKCAWGKVFGPWSQGACSVVYDFRGRFEGKTLLDLLGAREGLDLLRPADRVAGHRARGSEEVVASPRSGTSSAPASRSTRKSSRRGSAPPGSPFARATARPRPSPSSACSSACPSGRARWASPLPGSTCGSSTRGSSRGPGGPGGRHRGPGEARAPGGHVRGLPR